ITIDDVLYVIDCGKVKVKNFHPQMNLPSLEIQWVSKANAKQRRGRAGRVQAGHCFHLYTAFHYMSAPDYLPPEMLRTRLEELCLQIKLLKLGKILPFISKAMEHPSVAAISHAIESLVKLSALDAEENLLPLGYHLARLPMEPHTGKMILFGAMFCCLDPILTVAASLSFKDAFTIPLGKEEAANKVKTKLAGSSRSDHIMLINAFKGWEKSKKKGCARTYCWQHFLSENTLQLLHDMKKQLAHLLYDIGFLASPDVKHQSSNKNSENLGLIKAVLCAGFYPNVAQIVEVANDYRLLYNIKMMVKDRSLVMPHPKSVNSRKTYFDSVWMVYHCKLKTKKVYIHDCTMVSPYPLLFFGGDIKIIKNDGQEMISVDDWIQFRASASVAQLVKDLRHQLDKLLKVKISHPGPTIWDKSKPECAIMTAILDLIACEEKGYQMFGHKLGGSIGTKPCICLEDDGHQH
ncbi:ATP-dependent RNA helicase DHX36, partial [Biomphalaria glabrata]